MLDRKTFSLNLLACHRCAGGATSPGQIVACPDDGKPCVGHAQAGECPRALLRKVPPLPPQQIPDDFDPAQEVRRMRAGGCCGKPSASDGE